MSIFRKLLTRFVAEVNGLCIFVRNLCITFCFSGNIVFSSCFSPIVVLTSPRTVPLNNYKTSNYTSQDLSRVPTPPVAAPRTSRHTNVAMKVFQERLGWTQDVSATGSLILWTNFVVVFVAYACFCWNRPMYIKLIEEMLEEFHFVMTGEKIVAAIVFWVFLDTVAAR